MAKAIKNILLTLWGAASLVFLLFNVLPTDPARMLLDQREDAQQLALIKKKYGFDKPIALQYLHFLNDLSPVSIHSTVPNDFHNPEFRNISVIKVIPLGSSFIGLKWPWLRESLQQKGKKVSTLLGSRLGNTMVLAFSAISLAFGLSILFGIVSALNAGTLIDRTLLVFSSFFMAMPSFLSSILAAWFFAFLLHDITGLSITGNLFEWDDMGENRKLMLKNLILPAFTLGLRPLAVLTQLVRNSFLEVLQADYIKTAISKGIEKKKILLVHALPNALNPVLSAASGWFASMLAGSVFVEYIFGWNGLGKLTVEALNQLDVPVVMGCVLCFALLFILLNRVVDQLYKILDPRIGV